MMTVTSSPQGERNEVRGNFACSSRIHLEWKGCPLPTGGVASELVSDETKKRRTRGETLHFFLYKT
jgi:hypothetical protein